MHSSATSAFGHTTNLDCQTNWTFFQPLLSACIFQPIYTIDLVDPPYLEAGRVAEIHHLETLLEEEVVAEEVVVASLRFHPHHCCCTYLHNLNIMALVAALHTLRKSCFSPEVTTALVGSAGSAIMDLSLPSV